MPFIDLEKEFLEQKVLEYRNVKNKLAQSSSANDMEAIFHSLLVRKEREYNLEALIYKLAEAVNIDLDNLEE